MPTEYKIRRPDGLYSTGGCCPRWTKGGKTWTNLGHVKNHLKIVNNGTYSNRCELVTLEITITETPGISLNQLRAELNETEAQQSLRRENRLHELREINERAELARLKRQYEGI